MMWAGLIQPGKDLTKLRLPGEEGILPQDSSTYSHLSFQSAGLPHRFQNCQATPHKRESLFLGRNLVVSICMSSMSVSIFSCILALSIDVHIYIYSYIICTYVCMYLLSIYLSFNRLSIIYLSISICHLCSIGSVSLETPD